MTSIISRARWGAQYDRGFRDAPLPAGEVWLHHSVTVAPDLKWIDVDKDGVEDDEERAMRTLELIGEQRFGGGISYTFAVMPSGRIYEGHGVERQGAHTGGRNDVARAIVLVGDYEANQVTNAQIRAVAWLLRHGHASRWWTRRTLNGGHRQAPGANTACPGKHGMTAIPVINQLAASNDPIEEDDMFEDKDRATLNLLKELHIALVSGPEYGLGDIEEKLGKPVQYRRDLGTVRGDIRGVATQVAAVSGALSQTQATILAAISADATDQVDVDKLAVALRDALSQELVDDLVARLTA